MSQQKEVINEHKVVTSDDIKDFLSTYVKFGGGCNIDQDGYIVTIDDDTTAQVLLGDNKQPLIMYSENITAKNVIVLNPFSETTTMTLDREWFYKTFNESLTGVMLSLVLQLHETAIAHKVDSKNTKNKITDIELLSPVISLIDEKMKQEFDTILRSGGFNKFITIYFSRKEGTAKVQCALNNPDIRGSYPKLRKSTWEKWNQIMEILFGNFGVNHVNKAVVIGCPQLDAVSKTFYSLLSASERYMKWLGVNMDLDSFKRHIENIPVYYQKTRWLGQANAVKTLAIAPASVAQQPIQIAPMGQQRQPTTNVVGGVKVYNPAASMTAPPMIPVQHGFPQQQQQFQPVPLGAPMPQYGMMPQAGNFVGGLAPQMGYMPPLPKLSI